MDLTLFKSFSSGWSTIHSHLICTQSILLLHNLFLLFHTFQQKAPSSTSEPQIRVPTSNAWTKCESFPINSKCLADVSIMVHLLMTYQACQSKEKGNTSHNETPPWPWNQSYFKKQLSLANTRSIWQKKEPTLLIET